MIKLSKAQLKAYNNGDITIDALANLLIAKYPVMDIAKALVEVIADDSAPVAAAPSAAPVAASPKKKSISVTQTELDDIIAMFRVKGSDGRGRKPKVK